MIRAPLLLLALAAAALAPAALAQQLAMKILVVESVDGFQDWLRTSAAAGTSGTYPPSLKEVPEGRQVHFPIVVTGLRPPATGVMELVADVEFVGPDGASRVMAKECCRFAIANQPDVRTVMLGPTVNTKLVATDAPGIYTVRATVTGGPEVLVASETFRFVGGTPPVVATPAPTVAPRLNMNPPARNPGDDSDKRDCLALPTPTEVIKCTERKR